MRLTAESMSAYKLFVGQGMTLVKPAKYGILVASIGGSQLARGPQISS
jgi:hypothetical protein